MTIRHADIVIDKSNPFANCKLDRKKYADVLTQIIKSYDDGFVLAINNEWGTGKTTFVRMWQQQLENDEIKTLYFNAWESDFEINPITAILAEFKKLLSQGNHIKYHSLLKKGAVLAQNILPGVIKGISKRYIDADEVVKALEGATKGATEILKNEIDSYIKKQEGFKEFREELEKFVIENVGKKPVVFLIDELDRCRPDFAVEVLEKMKHFFTVPGIVFVLTVDKRQLENAIRGYYGSEQFNAIEYLRRFIDIEYNIPAPNGQIFCNYLYAYYKFDEFFANLERAQYRELQGDARSFIDFSSMFFQKKGLTLRQQEKIFAHARVALKAFKFNNYLFPSVFIFLVYVFIHEKELYTKIKNLDLSLQDFITSIEKTLEINTNSDYSRSFMYIEALLLYFYYNYRRNLDFKFELIIETGDDKGKLNLKCIWDSNGENSAFVNLLDSFDRSNFYNLKIDYLLNKIELTEDIN